MSGKLYITATPIGNLKDISAYALETLSSVDYIACEDTRRSAVLLDRYNIKKPLISCHKFNEKSVCGKLIGLLKGGANIALISDAGMPLISDPGGALVGMCRGEGIEVTCVSGATALINALVLSGMDTGSFLMLGFLPKDNTARQKYIAPYTALPCTLVFYSAPHDVNADREFLYSALGDRKAAVARELTKMYEEVKIINLSEEIPSPRGEYVLVVEGYKGSSPLEALTVAEHIAHYVNLGESKKDAVKLVAKDRNIPKSEVYKYSIDIED